MAARITTKSFHPGAKIIRSVSDTDSQGNITVNVEYEVKNAYGGTVVRYLALKYDKNGKAIDAGDEFSHFK